MLGIESQNHSSKVGHAHEVHGNRLWWLSPTHAGYACCTNLGINPTTIVSVFTSDSSTPPPVGARDTIGTSMTSLGSFFKLFPARSAGNARPHHGVEIFSHLCLSCFHGNDSHRFTQFPSALTLQGAALSPCLRYGQPVGAGPGFLIVSAGGFVGNLACILSMVYSLTSLPHNLSTET